MLSLTRTVSLMVGVAAAALVAPNLFAQDVLRQVDDGRVLLKELVVGSLASSPDDIRALALSFLKNEGAHHQIIQLIIAESREAVANSARSRINGLTFAQTATEIGAKRLPVEPAARALGISGAVLLSHRYGGSLHQEVLSGGADPTDVIESNVKFRILHVSLTKLGPASEKQPDFVLHIYASASSISATSAASLARKFAKLTNATTTIVSVRPDPWFLDDSDYPAVLPFMSTTALPSEVAYRLSPSVACSIDSKGLKCGGNGFVP